MAEYLGEYNFKGYARNGNNNQLITGLFGYSILIYLLIQSFKKSNLIYTNVMWNGVYTIIATILGYYAFGERLNNSSQWFGLILVVVGTFFLSVGEIPL